MPAEDDIDAALRRTEQFARSGVLLGLDLDEARAVAAENGFILRDYADDDSPDDDDDADIPTALTLDLRPNRITVATEKGVVARIDGAG